MILGDHRGEGKKFLVHPRHIERRVAELGERYRIAVDPRARIWQLSLGEQQRVEILKALYREARILILDEPTAVLTPQEAESLFETLRTMADEGRTVIFISHKLHEVKAVSDRVTVLRGGKTVATVATADSTPRSLAALMVGRESTCSGRRERRRVPGEARARARRPLGRRATAAPTRCAASASTFGAGEIVAVAGVAGNGQRELAETVAGHAAAATRGTVAVARARRSRGGDAREAIRRGVAHVPEDRLHTGVAPSLSIALERGAQVVPRPRVVGRGPLLRLGAIRDRAATLIERYDVRGARAAGCPRGSSRAATCRRSCSAASSRASRACSSPPRRRAGSTSPRSRPCTRTCATPRATGMGVLLISEDLDEILALADRIVVMYEGAHRRRARRARGDGRGARAADGRRRAQWRR